MIEGEDLLSHLVRRIRKEGPLTFADFMAEALYHPSYGRYTSGTAPMGPEGDYITSPEVDPAFGRLVARCVSEMAARLEAGPFTIVEMGPGRGTLSRDVLAALAEENPALAARLVYLLVEASESLRAEQRSRLAGAGLLDHVEWVSWSDLRGRGPIRGCLFANEFLDALPVHLVEWTGGRLTEIHVGADAGGRLIEVPLEPSMPDLARYFERAGVSLSEGQRAEVNLEALRWIGEAASLLQSGYAMIVDYGHEAADLFSERRYAGTLVGYRRHHLVVDPLAEPGEHDLTSHVDFTSVARAAIEAGFDAWALTTQRKLLTAMGIAEMVAELGTRPESASEGERLRRRFALHALMSPSGMGETFKVMLLARRAPLEGLKCLEDRFRGTTAEIHARPRVEAPGSEV